MFAVLFGSALACPGSHAFIHAAASMDVDFTNSCEDVAAEIKARASAAASLWQDPHNHGIYSLLESTGDSYILTKRMTKNHVYTDKQDFKLTPNSSGGCSVVACSESQGLSAADKGTNFCDMFDLFCNSSDCSDGHCCKVLKYDLHYTISQKKCSPFWFNCPKDRAAELKTCLKMPSTEAELAEYEANAIYLQRLGAFDTMLEKKKDDKKPEGKCMNAQDEKLFPDIIPDMKACGKEIKAKGYRGLNALHHFKECMQTQHGFSKDCAECPGTLVACKALHCSRKCKSKGGKPMELWLEPCFECVAGCTEKMTKCAGIDKASFAKCQTMLTGELGWVCDILAGKKTVQQTWKELAPILKPKALSFGDENMELSDLFDFFEAEESTF